MPQVLRSLDKIRSHYTVFEDDQVLTDDQLNSVVEHLDEQNRLTRVQLCGVGIVCGLRVSLDVDKMTLTKGVGVTTDGDLVRLAADTVFTHFKKYGDPVPAPAYGPFHPASGPLTMFELSSDGTASGVTPLAQFGAAPKPLTEMAAVLFVESQRSDSDLCTSTDCDNLGQHATSDIKLLLLDKEVAVSLKETIKTPDSAARGLEDLVASRPLAANITSVKTLAQVYREHCEKRNLPPLVKVLPKLYQECAPFLSDLFPTDPTPAWIARLTDIRNGFAASPVGIQYFFDFLKDVIETYLELRDHLFGDTTVCSPDLDSFPKHLLLGAIVAPAGNVLDRTGFYPSPVAGAGNSRIGHVRFLATKLQALFDTFKLPTGAQPIRITPSYTEERSLEDRAIPYYYDPGHATGIHKHWSYTLTVRNMSEHNYSYNAEAYGAQGGARQPLASQIGRFSFFRVEGHLGTAVTNAVAFLEGEIKNQNLPFAVRAVLLGSDRTKVVVKQPPRWTDLHRFHHLVRHTISQELTQAMDFGVVFKERVDNEVNSSLIENAATLKGTTATKNAAVKAGANKAKATLDKSYAAFRSDPSWRGNVTETLTAAGALKFVVGEVAKTEVPTPLDSLIGSSHLHWIDWIDELIDSKETKQDDRQLYSKLLAEHPGLEHFGGVTRGGTLVLVYDDAGTVVADFMFPYQCHEEAEEADEPPLTPPRVRPLDLPDKAIRFVPALDTYLKTKIEPRLQSQVEVQKQFFDVFKDSVNLIGNVYTKPGSVAGGGIGGGGIGGGVIVKDTVLDTHIRDLGVKAELVDILRTKFLETTADLETRTQIEADLKNAEVDLAKAATDTTRYLATNNLDVKAGSDGFKAMTVISLGVGKLRDAEALKSAKVGLKEAAATASISTDVKGMIGRLGRGL